MRSSSVQPLPLLPAVILLLILPKLIDTSILPRRHEEIGLTGKLDLSTRFLDAVVTSVHAWKDGAKSIYDILQSPPHSPVSALYPAALLPPESCGRGSEDSTVCGAGLNGFGAVGEVHYSFADTRRNIKGESTQSFLACRCLSNKECSPAILMRPVTVKGSNSEVCMYEARKDPETELPMFSDCFPEALRVVSVPKKDVPFNKFSPWEYEVRNERKDGEANEWKAVGSRGWLRNCSQAEIDALPRVDVLSLSKQNVTRNNHNTPAEGSPCRPPKGYIYFLDKRDEDGEKCAKAYVHAQLAAANSGSQADRIATGQVEETYVSEKPRLVGPTDISLAISAAGLGLLVLWTRFHRQKKKAYDTWLYLTAVVVLHILAYGLEGLPLHIALGAELAGIKWISNFAHADVTLSLGEEQKGIGSTKGSVLIIQTIYGNVSVMESKVTWLKIALIISDVIAVILVLLTFATRCAIIRHVFDREEVFNDKEGDGDEVANLKPHRTQSLKDISNSTVSTHGVLYDGHSNSVNSTNGDLGRLDSTQGPEENCPSPIQRLKNRSISLMSRVIGLNDGKSYRS